MTRTWQAVFVGCVLVFIYDAAQRFGDVFGTDADRSERTYSRGYLYTEELDKQLQTWLDKAPVLYSPARAVITPHAGYKYCGECSAFAYRQIDPTNVKRVFIIGPDHYGRVSGCGLTSFSTYKTPLYDLSIDQQVYEQLEATRLFVTVSRHTDEKEHSIEMQLPFIAKVMERYEGSFTIVPVFVGYLNIAHQQKYGEIFAPYLANPENLFVISSDFCHWGRRFGYTPYNESRGEIYQFIEHLDRMGMDLIEKLDPAAFDNYLKTYKNTICGRIPIGILLSAVNTLRRNNDNEQKPTLRFLKYAQDRQCTSLNDSSVSFACGALTMQ